MVARVLLVCRQGVAAELLLLCKLQGILIDCWAVAMWFLYCSEWLRFFPGQVLLLLLLGCYQVLARQFGVVAKALLCSFKMLFN